MIVFRRRLIFWLIKAYFKKWGRTIVIFFLLGLLGFFALRYAASILPSSFPIFSRQSIGLYGAYTINDLPPTIVEKISRGLTKIEDDGTVIPDIASSWVIRNNGKEYWFRLRRDIYFSDGTHLTSRHIDYGFKDAEVERPDDYVIVFKLKDTYSPFLVTASRPIFKKGFIGVGNFKIKSLKRNGDFVSSIELQPVKSSLNMIKYSFYPTEESLKTAFVLGEVSEMQGIHDLTFNGKELSDFKSVKISKTLNNRQLVTIFYNNKDAVLSDKKVRNALSYSLPDNFDSGLRNRGPFPPGSWASSSVGLYLEDIKNAKEILKNSESASESSSLKFKLKTLSQYKEAASIVKNSFKKIDVDLEVEEVDVVPQDFQMFLGDFNLSKDPDQYLLWHSGQDSNISGYKSLRIDKLLEDGRKIIDINERKKLYSDFQKYLLDDSPASFLYIPYTYTISRT
jgi:peptide/nickel transport system substrate-binding protein